MTDVFSEDYVVNVDIDGSIVNFSELVANINFENGKSDTLHSSHSSLGWY